MPPHTSFAIDKSPGRADTLARSVAADILSGNRPVGSWLPGDRELAEAASLSVTAVRTALHQLEALGLVARGQDGGTLVVSGEVRAIYQFAAETAVGGSYLCETSVVVDRRRTVMADAELAVLLDVADGSGWLHLTGLRQPEDASFGPLSWVDAWIGGGVTEVPDGPVLTADALAALVGPEIVEVHEEVSAAPLTSLQARLLRARGGEGSLHVMRRYRRADGTLAAAVRDVHPAGRISVMLRSRRNAG